MADFSPDYTPTGARAAPHHSHTSTILLTSPNKILIMKRWLLGIFAMAIAYLTIEVWTGVNEIFAFGTLCGFLVSGIYFEWINPKSK